MIEAFNDTAVWEIVLLSLKVAGLAVLLSLPPALLVAKLLARPGLRGKAVISAFFHMPLVTPPVVTGYVLLNVFGKNGAIGSVLDNWGLGISFTWFGAALAAAVMAFPLILRPIRLAFEAQEPGLDEMAATLGASRLRRLFTIALPLAWPGVIAGTILGFAKALGEFGATITFVSNIPGETQTLSLAIYTLLQSPAGDSPALVLIGVAIAISFVAILISEILAGRWERKRVT